MPVALVRGVHINYEIVGTQGPFVALTPGSRRAYAELINLSKAIAANGYRVLLHDRRNCGASDTAFDGSGSEHDVWADEQFIQVMTVWREKFLQSATLPIVGASEADL